MRTKTNKTLLTATITGTALFAGSVYAAPIDDWTLVRDLNAGPESGLNTDSPTFGDGTANAADNIVAVGLFGEDVTLAIGETLTVSFGITYTGGGTNDTRYIVGDYGDDPVAEDGWIGGWNHTRTTNLRQARTDGSVQSTGGDSAAVVGATEDVSGTFSGDDATAYAFTMSITRESATTVDLVSSLVGGTGLFDQTYTANDVTTSLFTYNAAVIHLSGGLNLDQGSVTGAQYNRRPRARLASAAGSWWLVRAAPSS